MSLSDKLTPPTTARCARLGGYYRGLSEAQRNELGAPSTGQNDLSGGNWRQFFKGGTVEWKNNGTGEIKLTPFTIGFDGTSVNTAFTNEFNKVVGWEALGKATGNVRNINGGTVQDFEKGSIVKSSAGTFAVRGSIGIYYRANISYRNSATLLLPTSSEIATSYGWRQDFQGAVFTHSSQFGTHPIRGSVGGYYNGLTAAQKDQLGAATTEEAKGGDGNWQQFFKGGSVLWKNNGTGELKLTPFTIGFDGNNVNAAFTTKFNQVVGWDALGKATGNVRSIAGGSIQDFEKGTIIQTNTGVFALDTYVGWWYLNYPNILGLPIGSKVSIAGGFKQEFEKGIVIGTPNNQTFVLEDSFATYYRGLSTAQIQELGMPTSNFSYINGGKAQYFQNGAIYQAQSGIFSVRGTEFNQLYTQNVGSLGLPIGEVVSTTYGFRQDFQNGILISNVATSQTFALTGAIATHYKGLSVAQLQELGAPTSNIYSANGILRQDFQKGSITQNGSTVESLLWPTNLGLLGRDYLHTTGKTLASLPIAYTFTVDKQTDSFISISGIQGDAKVSLFNSQNQLIANDISGGNSTRLIDTSLAPGSYTIKVTSGSVGNFILNVTPLVTINTPTPPVPSTTSLGLLGQNSLHANGMTSNILPTIYNFTVDRQINGFISISAIQGDAKFSLFNSQNQLIANDISGGNNTRLIDTSLAPGNYIVKITSGSFGSFTLNVTPLVTISNPAPQPTGGGIVIVGSVGNYYYSLSTESRQQLGSAKANQVFIGGGLEWKQDFQNGTIFHGAKGSFVVKNSLKETYYNDLSSDDRQRLGMPIGNETQNGGYWHQSFENGELQIVQGSPVKWNDSGNSSSQPPSGISVDPSFSNAYAGADGANGILHNPTSNSFQINGGWQQNFQGGAIISSNHGIFTLYGGIGSYYLQNEGGANGRLGVPTSGEQGIGNGKIVQHFQNGDILYGNGVATSTLLTAGGAVNYTEFTGVVRSDVGIKLRQGPTTGYNYDGISPYNQVLQFDAWTTGDSIPDPSRNNALDNRWFHVVGTNNWVASAYINGDPDRSVSTPAPNNPSPINNPPTIPNGSSAKLNDFLSRFNGTTDIQRLDRNDLPGQCVSLIARYLEEEYLVSSEKTKSLTLGNGADTAKIVANLFSNYFNPVSDPSPPVRGSIISFPGLSAPYGHTAIVTDVAIIDSQSFKIKIVDSNADGKAGSGTRVVSHDNWITIDKNGNNSGGYGSGIYWVNPKDVPSNSYAPVPIIDIIPKLPRTGGDGNNYLNWTDSNNYIKVDPIAGNNSWVTITTSESYPYYASSDSGFNNGQGGLVETTIKTSSINIGIYKPQIDPANPDKNFDSKILDKKTWLVIHGFDNDAKDYKVAALVKAIDGYKPGDQILVLDWGQAAKQELHRYSIAVGYINIVAHAAANRLIQDLKIQPGNINIVGHSLGSLVGYKISEYIANQNADPSDPKNQGVDLSNSNNQNSPYNQRNQIDTLFALDPAAFSSIYSSDNVSFKKYSKYSWSFYGSGLSDDKIAVSADKSFEVKFSDSPNERDKHGLVVNVFINSFLNKNFNFTMNTIFEKEGFDGVISVKSNDSSIVRIESKV